LINVITTYHPDNPSLITPPQYESAHKFLKNFNEGKKYTLNYDLILYWVYMHWLETRDQSLKCNDGFIKGKNETIIWDIGVSQQQDIYFLHGAIHIFSNGEFIEKCTWHDKGISIKKQVEKFIIQDKYPVFISEGKVEHKRQRILNNGYLNRALVSLRSISGNIFIFGHSLREEDAHIFDIINRNVDIKNIFVSIYGDIRNSNNQKIIEVINNKWKQIPKNKKNYYLYDAESAKVWNNSN
jgi:hypothetical protein